MKHQFHIYPDATAMAEAATQYFIKKCAAAVADNGRCVVCLSGGSTPKRMFKLLAQESYREQVDWSKLWVFWGDERPVPQSSPESNSGEAMRLLFNQVPVPKEQVFPIDGSLPPAEAANDYEELLGDFFEDYEPYFDICFLGMGDDGHTASLFPYADILYDVPIWVKDIYVEKLNTTRISLTPEIINQAIHIVFLIGGENKAEVLKEAIEGDVDLEKLPSQLVIRGGQSVEFFLDEGAAKSLSLSEIKKL